MVLSLIENMTVNAKDCNSEYFLLFFTDPSLYLAVLPTFAINQLYKFYFINLLLYLFNLLLYYYFLMYKVSHKKCPLAIF